MREGKRNKDTPRESFLNGGHEVGVKSGLFDVAEGTCSQASTDEIKVGMNRQENDLCRAAGFAQLLAGLYAIENRHGDIRDDDIGLKVPRRVEQRLAVGHAPDNFAS